MKILALEHELPGATADKFKLLLKAEAAKAWEYYRTGVFREMYFRDDVHTAVLILECANVDEANRVLATLPLVQAGLIEFEVMPLVPYSGFARLFAEEKI